jgi:hypothetical protein
MQAVGAVPFGNRLFTGQLAMALLARVTVPAMNELLPLVLVALKRADVTLETRNEPATIDRKKLAAPTSRHFIERVVSFLLGTICQGRRRPANRGAACLPRLLIIV